MYRRLIPTSLSAALFALAGLLATSCGASESSGPATPEQEQTESTDADEPAGAAVPAATNYGAAPVVPAGELDPELAADLDLVFASIQDGPDLDAIQRVGGAGDARVAWLLTDLLRFTQPGSNLSETVFEAWQAVTGSPGEGSDSRWGNTTNHLIEWDTPAPPGYIDWKRQIFELVEPGWAPFFDDADATIDWRWVSWGGVLIDDRPIDQTRTGCPEGCIPALNDPALTAAAGGEWYPDDRVVFGVVVDDQAVAFPKNIMEIHEMVNMTISGRRIGMPYCTLCGSAQAYYTDDVTAAPDVGSFETYELRTSGLLSRSNKVMYELHTQSVFDTFTGKAVTGPLRAAGVTLEQLTVQVSTWGDWKSTHPSTLIIAEDGGIGRSYAEDPLRGRDDDGPIFPIGGVDQRLGVQESVVGVVLDDGTALAFPAEEAAAALAAGTSVELAGVELETDGGGITARLTGSGEPVAAHESFWFAWSQFHTDTLLWSTDGQS